MKKFVVRIAYNGNAFHGWQYQPNIISGQEYFERALEKIAKKKITSYASGRTDSGVHALCQYVHFSLETRMDKKTMFIALQTKLPKSIRVLEVQEVSEHFHTRYDAYKRSYLYFICKERTPFNVEYKTYLPKLKIQTDKIRACLDFFIGMHDFAGFAKPNPQLKSTICHLQGLELIEREHDYYFKITANRFLHNMVRRIVGTTLLFTNRGYDINLIKKMIEEKNPKQKYVFTAPPTGLYLANVYYPNEINPKKMEEFSEKFIKYF